MGQDINDKEGVVKKEVKDFQVALDTEITEELQKEGMVREIVRTINQMRKEQKLTITDQVTVEYNTEDELLKKVFVEFAEDIKKQTLSVDLKLVDDKLEEKRDLKGEDRICWEKLKKEGFSLGIF